MNENLYIQLIASANHLIENAKRAKVAAERNQSDVKAAEKELEWAKGEKEKYEQKLSLIRQAVADSVESEKG